MAYGDYRNNCVAFRGYHDESEIDPSLPVIWFSIKNWIKMSPTRDTYHVARLNAMFEIPPKSSGNLADMSKVKFKNDSAIKLAANILDKEKWRGRP